MPGITPDEAYEWCQEMWALMEESTATEEYVEKLKPLAEVTMPDGAKEKEWRKVQAVLDRLTAIREKLEPPAPSSGKGGRKKAPAKGSQKAAPKVTEKLKGEIDELLQEYQTAMSDVEATLEKKSADADKLAQAGYKDRIDLAVDTVDPAIAASHDPAGAEWDRVRVKRGEIETAAAAGLKAKTLKSTEADSAETSLAALIAEAGTKIDERLRKEKDALLGEVATGKLGVAPPGSFPDDVLKLAALQADIDSALGTAPLLAAHLSSGRQKKGEMVSLQAAMVKRQSSLKDFHAGLDEVDANAVAGFSPQSRGFLADLAATFASPAEAVKYCREVGGAGALEAMLTAGCGGDAALLKEVIAQIKPAKLTAVLAKTGLAGKNAHLGQLVGAGCPGPDGAAKGVRLGEWLDKLDQDGDPMKTLLSDPDGLAKEPAVFGQLLGVGCEGSPAKYQTLLGGLKEGDLRNLNGLVKSGGFAAQAGGPGKVVQPDALGRLCGIGCGGDGGKLKALLDANSDPTSLANLKGMMEQGGLGAQPGVLGHVMKGCFTGAEERASAAKGTVPLTPTERSAAQGEGAAKLSALTGTFANVKDQDKLRAFMGQGGVGANAPVLDSLLQTGCGGDPAKLKTFVDGIQSTPALKQLDGVLNAGGLGADAAVFGHLVKTGCDGGVMKLNGFTAAFATPENQGKLNNLVTNGGFGSASGNPATLGQVMKSAFPGKPGNLVHLNDAFGGNTAELQGVMDAFNSGPPAAPNPGDRLKRVIANQDLPDVPKVAAEKVDEAKIKQLKTRFYDGLDAQTQDGSTVTMPSGAVVNKNVLPMRQLLRIAGTLELKAFSASAAKVTPPPALAVVRGGMGTAIGEAQGVYGARSAATAGFPDSQAAFDELANTGRAVQAAGQATVAAEGASKAAVDNPGTDNATRQSLKATVRTERTAIRMEVSNARTAAGDALTASQNAVVAAAAEEKIAQTHEGNLGPAEELVKTRRAAATTLGETAAQAEKAAADAEALAKSLAEKATQAEALALAASQAKPDPTDEAAVLKAAQEAQQTRSAADQARRTAASAQSEAGDKRKQAGLEKGKADTATKDLADAEADLQKKQTAAKDGRERANAVASTAVEAEKAAVSAAKTAKSVDHALLSFDCRDIGTADMEHICTRHTRAMFGVTPPALSDKDWVEGLIAGGSDQGEYMAKSTTFFPEETTPGNLTAIINEALSELSARGDVPTAANSLNSDPKITTPSFFVDLPKAGIEVKIGFKLDGDKFMINQFYPVRPLPGSAVNLETVPFWDMHAIKKAFKG